MYVYRSESTFLDRICIADKKKCRAHQQVKKKQKQKNARETEATLSFNYKLIFNKQKISHGNLAGLFVSIKIIKENKTRCKSLSLILNDVKM